MKTRLLSVLLLLSLAGCYSNPMQQEYTKKDGLQPLLNVKPPIDEGVYFTSKTLK